MTVGGVLAFVASAIGRPLPARAADGETVLVGGDYTSNSVTRITNITPRDSALPLEASSGDALQGRSSSGIALRGVSGSYIGVWGESTSVVGVRGISSSGTGVTGSSTSGVGVSGVSLGQGSGAVGVGGQSPGVAVLGNSDGGTAIYGISSTGYALRTSGRLRFDKASGSATVAAGRRSVVVTPGFELAASTKVLATLQGSAGGRTTIHRVTVDATADTFTVYLTANTTRSVRVAWLVVG